MLCICTCSAYSVFFVVIVGGVVSSHQTVLYPRHPAHPVWMFVRIVCLVKRRALLGGIFIAISFSSSPYGLGPRCMNMRVILARLQAGGVCCFQALRKPGRTETREAAVTKYTST